MTPASTSTGYWVAAAAPKTATSARVGSLAMQGAWAVQAGLSLAAKSAKPAPRHLYLFLTANVDVQLAKYTTRSNKSARKLALWHSTLMRKLTHASIATIKNVLCARRMDVHNVRITTNSF